MSAMNQEFIMQSEKDTKSAFKELSSRLDVIFKNKSMSDFQEELLRQHVLDCKKYFARWMQKSSIEAKTFKSNLQSTVIWECLENPIWKLREWVNNKIKDNSPQPVGESTNGD